MGQSEESKFATNAVEHLTSRYRVPLERAGIDLSALEDEWIDMVDYGRSYL